MASTVDLDRLDSFLSTRSYVELVHVPTENDVRVFKSVDAAGVCDKKYPHAARWVRNIKYFLDKRADKIAAAQSAVDFSAQKNEKPVAAALAPAADDLDLFGSDEEADAEAEALKAQRVKEYNEKKSRKPTVIAKSSVTLDVKPWEDTTDMKELEKRVRDIQMDGLLWGSSKLVPIGYGIRKLQIITVIEDDKVGVDLLEEAITGIEELVQSVDIVSFNKI